MGAERSGYDESQKRSGITRETWSIQETPDGSVFVLVWFESPDPDKSFAELAQDVSDFAVWFRGKVKEISGVDLAEPPEQGGSRSRPRLEGLTSYVTVTVSPDPERLTGVRVAFGDLCSPDIG
jgi:hypothetical protein